MTDKQKANYIIHLCELDSGLSTEEMMENTRKRAIVQARYTAMVLMKKHTKLTRTYIGSLFGRDHATVWHAEKTMRNLVETDKQFKSDFEKLNRKVYDSLTDNSYQKTLDELLNEIRSFVLVIDENKFREKLKEISKMIEP